MLCLRAAPALGRRLLKTHSAGNGRNERSGRRARNVEAATVQPVGSRHHFQAKGREEPLPGWQF